MRIFRYAFAVTALALLSACGGGGGGGASNSGTSDVLPPSSANGSSSIPQSVVVPKYTIVDLGANVSPSAINSSNEVVGSVGSGNSTRAFSYQNGAMHVYGTLPGDIGSAASDVNDADTIVGSSFGPANTISPISHAVTFTSSAIVNLGGLSGVTYNVANAVNNAGEIAGVSGALQLPASTPCLVTAVTFDGHGGATAIAGIPVNASVSALNKSGEVIGQECVGSPSQAQAFSDPPFIPIYGPADACPTPEVFANDINDSGDIVGSYLQNTSVGPPLGCVLRGYVLHNGTYTKIPGPAGNASATTKVNALNNADWLVGAWGNTFSPLLYAHGTSYDLKSLVTGTGCQNWTLQSATDINASNVIIGTGLLGGVEHGFMLMPQS